MPWLLADPAEGAPRGQWGRRSAGIKNRDGQGWGAYRSGSRGEAAMVGLAYRGYGCGFSGQGVGWPPSVVLARVGP